MIGVWFVFILTWVVAWILVAVDWRKHPDYTESAMRYMYLITIGLVVSTAVLLVDTLS